MAISSQLKVCAILTFALSSGISLVSIYAFGLAVFSDSISIISFSMCFYTWYFLFWNIIQPTLQVVTQLTWFKGSVLWTLCSPLLSWILGLTSVIKHFWLISTKQIYIYIYIAWLINLFKNIQGCNAKAWVTAFIIIGLITQVITQLSNLRGEAWWHFGIIMASRWKLILFVFI